MYFLTNQNLNLLSGTELFQLIETNKIKMINRCDLMLQDLKHFKTVIIQKCPKCPKCPKFPRCPRCSMCSSFPHVLLTISKMSLTH